MYDLNFTIEFHCTLTLNEMDSWFGANQTRLGIEWGPNWLSGSVDNTLLHLSQNDDYDLDKINDVDGWFHYKFTLEAYYRGKPETVEEKDIQRQIVIAQSITTVMHENGWLATIIGSIEEHM